MLGDVTGRANDLFKVNLGICLRFISGKSNFYKKYALQTSYWPNVFAQRVFFRYF